MPFEVRIRPVDLEPVKMVAKSRFKRIFERQFMRASLLEKVGGNEEQISNKKDGFDEFEPGSVCLARMVRNFIEDSPGKQRCMDSSDDEFDSCSCFGDMNLYSSGEALENVKSLVQCVSGIERNLLADTARIVDQNKISMQKDDAFLKIVNGLSALGYNASICNSHWGKSSVCPAGEYKYVDVIVEGERLIIDIDFRSEFEVARPTKKYRTILQTLPVIFVGKADRLQKIIGIVMEAAKQSLKKKGMPFPPWRKAEYVKAKWLSPYCRTLTGNEAQELQNPMNNTSADMKPEDLLINNTSGAMKHDDQLMNNTSVDMKLEHQLMISKKCSGLQTQLKFGEKSFPIVLEDKVNCGYSMTNGFHKNESTMVEAQIGQKNIELKKSSGVKITGGLACIIED